MKKILLESNNFAAFATTLKEFESDPTINTILILSSDIKYDTKLYDPILKNTSLKVMGGVFPEIIFDGKRCQDGLALIGFPNKIETSIISSFDGDHISDKLSNDFGSMSPAGKSFFVFIDALINEKSSLFDSLYNQYGTIPKYIGGGTGSLDFTSFPSIFTNEGILENVAMIAAMDLDASIGVAHGWEAITEPLKVTEAHKNKIITLNWRPAMEVYREVLEKHVGEKLNFDNFLATAKCYPFGISKLDNEMVVRDPYKEENGVIFTLDEIEQGSHVAILYGNMESLINGASKAREMAFENKTEEGASDLFLIDCISRVLFMNENFDKEIKNLDPDQKSFGALSLGEIANRGDSYLEVFNKTAVVFAING